MRLLPLLSQPDQLQVERSDRAGPRDPLLVGVLLYGRGHRPGRTEPVGTHPDELLVPVLVQVGGAERLGIAGAELEDVPDLDRRLDSDGRPAGARVTGLHGADVRPRGLEVAPRF